MATKMSRKHRQTDARRATEIRKGDMVQVVAGDDRGKVRGARALGASPARRQT